MAGLGLTLLEACLDPKPGTWLLMGGALLLLGLTLVLERLASETRLFSVRVRPELVLLTTSFFLGLLLSELVLQLLFFKNFPDLESMGRWGENLGYQYDRTLGWFPVPNSRRTVTAHRRFSVAHNSHGFRDPEPALDSRPGVLFLGDSFVWGYNVEASERFTDKLRIAHPEWRIYNFGVAAYSTDQEYLLLQQQFTNYHPQVVFLVFCTENDDAGNGTNNCGTWYFKPWFSAGSGGLRLHGVPVPRSDRLFCLQHPLLAKSYLVRLAGRAWANLLSPPPRMEPSPTTAILAALREYASAHGAAFCVGLTRGDPDLEQFLRSSKIPSLDLSTDLRVEDDVHWTPEGHTFVAQKIEPFLISGKFLPAPALGNVGTHP